MESLYRLSLKEQGWDHCYFVRDGDNEGNPFPNSETFVHLPKYCIENFLLDVSTAASLAGKSVEDVKAAILDSMQERGKEISRSNKFFEKLLSQLQIDDINDDTLAILDVGKLLPTFLTKIGVQRESYVNQYITSLHNKGRIASVFPEQLIKAIQG